MLATRLGGEFLPKLTEGSIVVTSEKLPGINLDATRGPRRNRKAPEACRPP
jgi:heavy metal efflux system protein